MSDQPQKPLMLVAPYCPWCGNPAEFGREPVNPEVPIRDRVWPVDCPTCAWAGQSKRLIPVPD